MRGFSAWRMVTELEGDSVPNESVKPQREPRFAPMSSNESVVELCLRRRTARAQFAISAVPEPE